MKRILTILTIMATTGISMAQPGKASTTRKAFSRETTVKIDIQADPAIVWTLLSNAEDFPRWNSTIISMKGEIKEGGKVALKSTLDTSRTFTLKVKSYIPEQSMVWTDGAAPFFKGVRTYTLTKKGEDLVTFEMTEKLGGLMFPMAAKHIPDFDDSFEQYANDLKKEAEIIQNAKN